SDTIVSTGGPANLPVIDAVPSLMFSDWLEENATSPIQQELAVWLRGTAKKGRPPDSNTVLSWLIEHSHLINEQKTREWEAERAREQEHFDRLRREREEPEQIQPMPNLRMEPTNLEDL